LERRGQLDHLQARLEEAASGSGRLIFVGGEAGVGKTSLVTWFGERARATAEVLAGACDPLTTPRPLGPLLDMDPAYAARSDFGPALFRSFLEDVGSRRKPSVVVFEDVHWADQATLDLLRFTGRRVGAMRALFLATYRDDELNARHPLRMLLGDLATQSSVERMYLEPLSREAVSLLARGSGLDASHLYGRTGGNPFFVTEVLLSADERIPATVRDAVLARAARLSPAARSVLDAAAVCGLRVEMWLLKRVADVDSAQVAECVDSGLLRPDALALRFRHELARGAIEEAIDVSESIRLHRAMLAALLSRPHAEADPARIAHHAEAAGDSETVRRYGFEAAQRAARMGAHREAAAEYGRVLRCANGLDGANRARVLEARAFECFVSDQLERSLEGYRDALSQWQQVGDPEHTGRSQLWIARCHWVAGRANEADEAATAAVNVLEGIAPGVELALAYAQRGNLCVLMYRNREAIEWCRRALGVLDRCDDVGGRVHATLVIGLARIAQGDDGGFDDIEDAIRVGGDHGLVDHVARGYFHCARATQIQRRHALTQTWFERGHAFCTEQEHAGFRRALLATRSRSLLNQGFWQDAEAMASEVLAGLAPSSDWRQLEARTVLALLRARRGDAGAAGYLDDSDPYVERMGAELSWSIGLLGARAEVAWLAGDPARALSEASAGLARHLRIGEPWGLGELSYWVWRSGGPRSVPGGAAAPWALQIAGAAEEAAALWKRLGCPYEEAQALAESDSEHALRQATVVFDGLGAKPAAARARRRLRELGAHGIKLGPRASTRANPAQLTARELEVLKLLAEGLSNRGIAERLYVSKRTIDSQVASIMAKLGVSSRTAAAREALRLGLTATD
jgi:DNA-binding CsgD family transcriptional regulator